MNRDRAKMAVLVSFGRSLSVPPFLVIAAAAAGALYGAKALKREWRRVNAALDESERATEERDRLSRPTLKRDRDSGEWRPR